MPSFELAFVDSISATPTTRINLNSSTVRTLSSGTEFGMPELERSLVSTLLSDGASVPAAAYGNRMISLAVDLSGVNEDAVASTLQSIAREIDRPHVPLGATVTFLRYKPSTSAPVFFRCLRSELSGVAWDKVNQRAVVSLMAEPFALGIKETSAPITLNNDPAAASNGMFFDVSNVAGDVETPVMIRFNNTSPFNAGTIASVIAVRRRGTPASMPLVLQCEAMTLGTDTTLPGNDAAMSGSGSNYARTSFATVTAMEARLSIDNWPASPSVDARGRYRVWARCRQSVGGDVMKLRFAYGAPGVPTNILNDTVTLEATTNRRWVDLGDLTMPIFGDPVDDGGVPIPVVGLGMQVQAQRFSGSGNLDLDCLLLVPADDRYASIRWSVVGAQAPDYLMVDGIHDLVYPMDSGPEVHSNNGGIPRSGGLPMLSPGVTNRVVVIVNATPPGQLNLQDTKTDTATIELSYYPRYLYVRPVSS